MEENWMLRMLPNVISIKNCPLNVSTNRCKTLEQLVDRLCLFTVHIHTLKIIAYRNQDRKRKETKLDMKEVTRH